MIFYLGNYGAFDYIALKACTKFKEYNKNCKSIFVTPYRDEKYLKLRKDARDDEIIYPEINTPKKFAILKRNYWMVEQADLIISYVKLSWGGAAKSLEYATKLNKRIINIASSF